MGCLLTRVKPQSPPDTGPRKTSNGTSSSADDEDDSDEGRQPTKKDVGLKSISNADLLTVQRQTSPDVTRNLEDRWMRSHFDIRHFEEQTVGGEHSLRRKSVSRTTYISDEIDHPSLAQSHEVCDRLRCDIIYLCVFLFDCRESVVWCWSESRFLMSACTFFSTVHLLPKDLRFEHGGRQTCFLPQAPSNLLMSLETGQRAAGWPPLI